LTKGDLGGFENLQTEEIYGKRYNLAPGGFGEFPPTGQLRSPDHIATFVKFLRIFVIGKRSSIESFFSSNLILFYVVNNL